VAIMTKVKQTGQRLMDYSFALVQLWFEATQFDRNETKFF